MFNGPRGQGYPKDRVVPEQRNKKILDGVKEITHTPMIEILKKIDRDFLLETIDRESFRTLFFKNAKDIEIVEFIKSLLD